VSRTQPELLNAGAYATSKSLVDEGAGRAAVNGILDG